MALQSLSSIIADHAARMGDAIAVTYPDGTLTWSALDQRSNRRARQLAALGVKRDDLVAVMLPNGTEFHEAVAGVWKAGATPCVLPSNLPGREAMEMLALARPTAVIGDIDVAHAGARIPAAADLSAFSADPVGDAGAAHWKAVASGGSSGRPKIILDTMPAFIDPETAPYLPLGLRPGGAMLNPGPLYHNVPFLFTGLGLLAGAHVVGMRRFDAEEALRLIDRHRVEFVVFVPTMMQRILALPDAVRQAYDVSSLKMVWHMAAPCPAWVKRGWIDWLGAERIFEAYGGTEGGGGTAITGQEWLAKPGSVGRAVSGALRVLREDGSEADVGEVGEIHFAPAGRDRFRYVGAEAKTNADGGFSIGDLGHIDEDGYLFLADRRSDLILRGGANVYPAEVEAALDEHPLVSSSAVIGLPSEDLGERVHAIIELCEGERLDLAAIAAHLEDRLAKYKRPATYEISQTPLRDDAGKVRRSLLKAERRLWLEAGRAFELS